MYRPGALFSHGSILSFLSVRALFLLWLNSIPAFATAFLFQHPFSTPDRATCMLRQRLPSPPIAPPTRIATPPPALGAMPPSTPPPTRRGWRKEGLAKRRPERRASLRRSPGPDCSLGCHRRLDKAGQDWRRPNKNTTALQRRTGIAINNGHCCKTTALQTVDDLTINNGTATDADPAAIKRRCSWR